ncbi:MAG: 23S rRNA pseudouridine(2604) synthase RluF [Lachnospiraceae bacterium]|nr:23S rRNA pseudouridine(2604) synthase RluF [Lachnospiraceae bacterium]
MEANVEGIRINKYLSEAGICSRREADRKVAAGEVHIDGVIAENGSKVSEGQTVTVNGKVVSGVQDAFVLIAFHKPRGVVCTTQKKDPDNIVDYIKYPVRIYPVGRLDKESTGLILLTNQGDLVNKMMRSGNAHEKEYLVTVNKDVTEEFLEGLANGVPILDVVTRKCKVEKIGKRKFRMVLTQGLNRQIRRMCEYFGYRVVALKRVRIMNIRLGDLKEGTYRNVTKQELEVLMKLIEHSSNEPVRYEGDMK